MKRTCPQCEYDLSGQPDGPRLTCPECGLECSRTQAEATRYMKRTRWRHHITVAFWLGTLLQIVNLCTGMTHPIGIAVWTVGGLLILAAALGFTRANPQGYAKRWRLWGIALGLLWIVLIHSPIIFGVAYAIIFGRW